MSEQNILTPDETTRFILFIESIGGGYPLVTVSNANTNPKVLWQYESSDIIIDCAGGKICLPKSFPTNKTLKLNAPTLEHALNLIHVIEKERQEPNDYPFLRFGMIKVRDFP